MLTLLHTSDWHLGHSLYGKRRHEEFEAFLGWLLETLRQKKVEVLLICGDVFDNTTPGSRTQEQYYQFLASLKDFGVRHTVIIGGNHDSPSFLNAPQNLLKNLNIHVVGQAPVEAKDSVLLLKDERGELELIVCSVPFLRDRELRQVEDGESLQTKDQKLRDGVVNYYQNSVAEALRVKLDSQKPVPIVALGHLFAAGGTTVADDGVRDLYVGSLAMIHQDSFPKEIDYLALGHLHQAQLLGKNPTRRYCGSPLIMGFNEIGQHKHTLLVKLADQKVDVLPIEVPCFQKMQRISGDRDTILAEMGRLIQQKESVWVEVICQGLVSGLAEELNELSLNTGVEILRIRVQRDRKPLDEIQEIPRLEELKPEAVFELLLSEQDLTEDKKNSLRENYQTILYTMQHENKETAT